MGAHLEYAKYIKIHHNTLCFDVFLRILFYLLSFEDPVKKNGYYLVIVVYDQTKYFAYSNGLPITILPPLSLSLPVQFVRGTNRRSACVMLFRYDF